MQPLPPGVGPGARVSVRGGTGTVDTCVPHEDCTELRFVSLDSDRPLVLLWPFDRPTPQNLRPRLRVVRPSRWLRQARSVAAGDRPIPHLLTPPRETRTTGRAVLAYQLLPALAVADGARRVLLADEVGLGKTAQAGWIIDDTLARRPDARILIAVPAGMRLQWTRELQRLFSIAAHVVDARWLLRTVNGLPAGVNVWTPPGVYVVSLDFLKRPDITASAVDVTWDLVVVDEAHAAAAPTERYKTANAIARRSRAVVLITATPFSGDEASFASLMSLGAIDDTAPALMFRRSRTDVGDVRRRRHRFVRVAMTAAGQQVQRLLERYCREIWTHAPSPEGRLAAIVLRKRALSSVAALARSLRRRQRLLATPGAAGVQLTLFDADTDDEDDEPGRVLGAQGLGDAGREHRWLDRLVAASERAAASEPKIEYLRRLLRRIRAEPVVVFTEFRDTLEDLAGAFPSALRLHGGMTSSERDDVQTRFNAEGGRLFATDAAAHGLNLHGRCRLVVNFELPWNPARLEQRIGRVDRIGQARVVHAATLVARDTAEDLVIANIARRLTRVAGTLGRWDRLASFLDDARIAGMAIGGDPIPDLEADDERRVPVPDAAVIEATRQRSKDLKDLKDLRDLEGPGIVVSSVRATRKLPPGFVAIVQWTLREPAGRVATSRTLCFHVSGSLRKPVTAAEANRLAAAAIATHGARLAARARTEVGSLREASLVAHRRAVGSRIDREIEIGAGQAPPVAQPGLFDRRGEGDPAWREPTRDEHELETSRRVVQLRASMTLEERTDVRGVLLLWTPPA